MKKWIYLCLFCFLGAQCLMAQQAWTKPKGKYFAQIGVSTLPYNGVLIDNEVKLLNRRIRHTSLQFYGEYGISDRWMVSLIVPVIFEKSTLQKTVDPSEPQGGSLTALSNIDAGVSYNFYQKNGIVLTAKVNAVLPTARYDAKTGLRTGIDAFALEPSILAGIGRSKYFSSIELGYGYRSNDYSSLVLGAFQIGKYMGKQKRLIGIFNINLHISNKDGKYDDANSIYTATYLNDLRYLAPGFKFGYKIGSGWMVWANIRGALGVAEFIGSNEALTPGLSFSISHTN